MPTSQTKTADLEASATGEAKPKRVRKPSAPKAARTSNPGLQTLEPSRKAARRGTAPSTPQVGTESMKSADGFVPTLVSNEDVSIRAYFIAENRRALGLSGDCESDWLEAERQLKAEAAGIAASLRQM